MEGSGCDLFEGIIVEFAWMGWRKPQNPHSGQPVSDRDLNPGN
jgi:hypothetical protein